MRCPASKPHFEHEIPKDELQWRRVNGKDVLLPCAKCLAALKSSVQNYPKPNKRKKRETFE
jgi:hypothetical protein